MRVPESLSSLVYDGIVDQVVRPLMSGKEAQVYLVLSGGYECVAKIYKDAQHRTFQNRATYTEGRKVRNTRDQRAMDKRTRHGKAQDEAAWRNTEVDMIYRLRAAGVRVPIPHHYIDGVLIMELVCDAEGEPAPRLGDVMLEAEEALRIFDFLLSQVQRMLCAGVVHGDLSDFNVLLGAGGPVIIDFPQSVHASNNQNARKLLLRDVNNLHRFRSRFQPEYQPLPYAEEMWHLYERNQLTPDTKLSGRFQRAHKAVNTASVLDLIGDASRDERKRREARGMNMRGLDGGVDGGPVQTEGNPSPGRTGQREPARDQPQPRNQERSFQRDAGRPGQREPARDQPQPRNQERSFQRDVARPGQREPARDQPQPRNQERSFQRDAGRPGQREPARDQPQPRNQERSFQRDVAPPREAQHNQERSFQREGQRRNFPQVETRSARPRLDEPSQASPQKSSAPHLGSEGRPREPQRERSDFQSPEFQRRFPPSQTEGPGSRESESAAQGPLSAEEAERKRRRRRRRRSGPKTSTPGAQD